MPYLGDYLGQLLAEVVIARAHADLETLRVAELYASHEYLKHFPVAHLRLPTITLDLAYVVDQSEEVPVKGPPRGGIDPEAMLKNFNDLLSAHLQEHHFEVDKKSREKLGARLRAISRKAVEPPQVGAVALRASANAMTDAATKSIRESAPELSKEQQARLDAFAEEMREAAYGRFASLRDMPPRLRVLVTKKELIEVKNPELLSRLRLTISEEGQEWSIVAGDGQPRERLIPE